jgi:glycosyltransferase involved in cell wall biosynthesis
VRRYDRARRRYILDIVRRGPAEAAYAFLRARRRNRNVADEEPALSPSDRLALSGAFDATADELAANAELLDAYRRRDALDVRSLQWFIPWFHNPHGGGVHTILRFSDHLVRAHGVECRFCVYDRTGAVTQDISAKIGHAFPSLAAAPVTTAAPTDRSFAHLPECDAALATTWTSAYPVLRFARTRAKFFFVQDFEPEFYPAGSASALLEQAARFGLPGIVNTPGLADVYRSYGNEALSFLPAVDSDRFHPPAGVRDDGPVRIVFYGRPLTPRNAFGLGAAALRQLKGAHGDAVRIVSVGEDWHPGQYGLADVLENAGALEDLDEVAELYRASDIGLVFMLTKHPSYQPFEFMASGVATVSNESAHTRWFLRHEHNALLAPPLPSLVAEQLDRLVRDRALRERLAANGLADVSGVRWDEQFERAWKAMTKRGEPFRSEPETA